MERNRQGRTSTSPILLCVYVSESFNQTCATLCLWDLLVFMIRAWRNNRLESKWKEKKLCCDFRLSRSMFSKPIVCTSPENCGWQTAGHSYSNVREQVNTENEPSNFNVCVCSVYISSWPFLKNQRHQPYMVDRRHNQNQIPQSIL